MTSASARGARVRARRLHVRLRQVGPRRAAAAGLRRLGRKAQGTALDVLLRRRPRRVGADELDAALGGLKLDAALRELARPALPTVVRFEQSLATLDDEARRSLLDRADALLDHRFDLLGSGPTELGRTIDWSRDFVSGRTWPLRHFLLLQTFRPDGSDVKMPWELSRFQHLPLLAAAYRISGERSYLDEIGAQLDHWIASNPVEIGVNWLCTMDVAIRAANWVATLAMLPDEAAREPWGRTAAESLLLHGRFIRGHLETAGGRRTNHYLSDVAGLLVVAALFARGQEGAAWGDWATGALIEEMDHQVRADGCGNEASIPYHRLVCELFVCGTQAADALGARELPAWYRERLDLMLRFVSDYTRPDSLAPQLGDSDDGRFLPLGDYGSGDFRSHLHLFDQAQRERPPATSSGAYPDGGYYVMRGGDLYVLARCGDTGMHGLGGHAHNDQLAVEICCGDQPLVVDPGTGDYYRDEQIRLGLRSTRSHATLQIDGAEQSELPVWPRFPLGDGTRAEATEWSVDDDSIVFAGRHHGYERLPSPATHERRVELRPREQTVIITDRVVSAADHLLEWAFPLAGGEATVDAAGATAVLGDCRLSIVAEGVELYVEQAWYSPSFGVQARVPVVRGRRRSAPGVDVVELRLSVERVASGGA